MNKRIFYNISSSLSYLVCYRNNLKRYNITFYSKLEQYLLIAVAFLYSRYDFSLIYCNFLLFTFTKIYLLDNL